MEILSTIWQITQILLLIAVAISSVMLLTALFHPLRFDVKLRGSVKGQRAEVWFVYLFRLFKIGVIATPHTQDLIVSFMGWKKRINRLGTRKPENPPPTTPPETTPTAEASSPPPSPSVTPEKETKQSTAAQTDADADAESIEPNDEIVEIKEGSGNEAEKTDFEQEEKRQENTEAIPDKKEVETLSTEDSAKTQTIETKSPDQTSEKATETSHEEPEVIEPVCNEKDSSAAETDSRPLKPLSEVEAEYKAAKEEKPGEASVKAGAESSDSSTQSLKQMLRRFKRDASRRFNQFKTYARLFRLKWRSLSPVFKRFWHRGKRGFGLPRIDLLLRYALHEPYLTGMCHGTLAVASGMAGQWGINFVPVPQFGAPALYSRAYVTAVIRPWRLLYATGALLFEKQLYKEIWQLFKWYRAKKQD